MKHNLLHTMVMAAAVSGGLALAGTPTAPATPDSDLASKVAHEIRMYPRYTIWDDINLRVQNGNVDLTGEVSQPYKKSELGKIVASIPGVKSVTNDLEVLPLSRMDDQLRVQVARALFRDPSLSRYAMEPVPAIHIIVENGHVTLEGVVSTEMDKNIAGIRANGAGLSFGSVVNNLRVESTAKKS